MLLPDITTHLPTRTAGHGRITHRIRRRCVRAQVRTVVQQEHCARWMREHWAGNNAPPVPPLQRIPEASSSGNSR